MVVLTEDSRENDIGSESPMINFANSLRKCKSVRNLIWRIMVWNSRQIERSPYNMKNSVKLESTNFPLKAWDMFLTHFSMEFLFTFFIKISSNWSFSKLIRSRQFDACADIVTEKWTLFIFSVLTSLFSSLSFFP